MGIEEKKIVVKNIKERLNRATLICFANFGHLSASRMNGLRALLKKSDAEMKVFKNRLILRALKENSIEELSGLLSGPTAMIFAYGDPIAAIKIIADFKSGDDIPVVNGGYIEGEIFDGESILKLATIPSREELYGKMIGIFSSSLVNMVYILSNIPRRLVNILSGIADQKEE